MALSRLLFRYLAHAMLVFALATGCSQSLFVDGSGKDPDGPPGPMPPDGSPGTANDGSMPPMPDGSLGTLPDGGDPEKPDAAAPRNCPAPCVGDAYADFDGQQGGINGRWRYVEFESEGLYADMAYDSSSGWRGSGSEPPTIVTCNVGATEPPCAELGGTLALTSNGPDGPHPALRWTAETGNTYLITGSWRGASTAPGIETLVRITHHSGALQTPVGSQQFPLSDETHTFEHDLSVAAGDDIVLSVQPVEPGSVTVGVELFISVF